MAKPVLIISGPTATGKTQLALELARGHHQLEVINFDSLLFYRELSIGTAKPTQEELDEIPHHLVNIRSISSPINAADFCELATPLIEQLHRAQRLPVLVGGSGFYLRALLKGMYEGEQRNPVLFEQIQEEYKKQGIGPALSYLKTHDPQSLERLHLNDHYRLLRAYEYHRQTGTPLSNQHQQAERNNPYDLAQNRFPDWAIHHIYLNIPPREHWPIMERRAQQMIQNGLVDEVKALLESGFQGQEKPLESIGYKETLDFLKAGSNDEKELIQRIYIATRRLAKAQRTFFHKITPKYEYHPLQDRDKILSDFQTWWESYGR